jgi:hypothetical protein
MIFSCLLSFDVYIRKCHPWPDSSCTARRGYAATASFGVPRAIFDVGFEAIGVVPEASSCRPVSVDSETWILLVVIRNAASTGAM